MRSAIHASFGNPVDVLTIEDRPLPEPGPGQVRIRMRLAAIHNHDLLTVSGQYGYKPPLPAIGGSEATGTIDALGDGVQGFKPGQRVAVSGVHGAWSEYFIASAASLVPVPDSMSDETAAQLIAMPLSALVLLEFVGATEGQWVIQNAATGAVAKVLAMIATTRGIHVVNLVRRAEAVEELRALGIDNVVSTDATDWQGKVKTLTGGASIVAGVDGVGGASAGDLMDLLSEGATLVSFGAMSGKPLQLSAGDLIFKQAVVKGFWLSKIMGSADRADIGRWMSELVRLVATGAVKLQSAGIFPLERIAEAAAASVEPGRPGKVLLSP
jgi:NADPH:quinone reductase-like Zn-dependent oxidoreductase